MNAYIYQAALYCEDCARDIKATRTPPRDADLSDERTFDSDDWPKGPYADGGGEADAPQHCDSCSVFLENPLTDNGRANVREQVESKLYHVEATFRAETRAQIDVYAAFYGIEPLCTMCGEPATTKAVNPERGIDTPLPHCDECSQLVSIPEREGSEWMTEGERRAQRESHGVVWHCSACGEDSDDVFISRALGCCPHCGSHDIDREET